MGPGGAQGLDGRCEMIRRDWMARTIVVTLPAMDYEIATAYLAECWWTSSYGPEGHMPYLTRLLK